MFTGIVEETGTVERRIAGANGVTFAVAGRETVSRLSPGDSVSVNGVCLTAERVLGEVFECTAVDVTLSRTTLAALEIGRRVNLELAATPVTALGGHLVQGHIDGVGRVTGFEEVRGASDTAGDLEGRLLTIELTDDLWPYIVSKGSIAIDGVSLTIADVGDDRRIAIAIVPHTVQKTIVSEYGPGTRVNVEIDIIAKYVRHYMQHGGTSSWFGRASDAWER